MNSPLRAGPNLPDAAWKRLRLRAIFDHCKWDPQCGDHAVLAKFPLLLDFSSVRELSLLAERLTLEALAAETEILQKPWLLKRLAIPRHIRKELQRDVPDRQPQHVRVMRFDFHFTTQGWQISEVNADVPGGYIEASSWNELLVPHYPGTASPVSATECYVDAICRRVAHGGLVALAHATVHSEDRQVMVHISRELERRGIRSCLTSPAHLRWENGNARLQSSFASEAPELIVRFSPAEWLPELSANRDWKGWFHESTTPLSNPGRALILQSKRFPLVWSDLETELRTWKSCLPVTRCPSEVRTLNDATNVLKPAFGRVGEGVGIPGVTGSKDYDEILLAARRHELQWIAQERFEVVPVACEEGKVFPCVGVYTVDGKMAGLYGRAARQPIVDPDALDVAILLRDQERGCE